jgi:hypothetical protein
MTTLTESRTAVARAYQNAYAGVDFEVPDNVADAYRYELDRTGDSVAALRALKSRLFTEQLYGTRDRVDFRLPAEPDAPREAGVPAPGTPEDLSVWKAVA